MVDLEALREHGWSEAAKAADEIERLRNDLAEVDGLLACHAHKLDPNPRERWPRDSVLGKAVDRHNGAITHAAK